MRFKEICEEHLAGRYKIAITDVKKTPEAAYKENAIVTPGVVITLRPQVRKTVGDLADKKQVMVDLEIVPQ